LNNCGEPQLTLTLLVARIGANHTHHTFAADDLAVPANAPYRSQNFHYLLLYVDVLPSRGFPSGSCVEI
jgi:hypothetical protein